jgi:DNA polymerase III alpha subunit
MAWPVQEDMVHPYLKRRNEEELVEYLTSSKDEDFPVLTL